MKRILIPVILAVLAAIAIGAIVGREWLADEQTATVTLTKVPVPDTADPIIDPDQQQTSDARPAGVDEHEDAKDETPPGVTPAEVQKIVESRPAGLGEPKPLGGAELLSCRWHPVQNFSARQAGARVSMPVVHYTVSAPGSLDAIWNLFNTRAFGASSHLLLEPDGRCEQLVSYANKAWTQGAFNSVADSVEIICCRTDPPRSWWLAQPIIKGSLLASWLVDRLRARGLPPRLVDPSGCTPRAGYTDHLRLECGNTHTDVGQHFPWDVVGHQVRLIYKGGSLPAVWRAISGGKVLHSARAKTRHGRTGYDRLVRWLRGPGEVSVRRAERANGAVRLVLVRVAP